MTGYRTMCRWLGLPLTIMLANAAKVKLQVDPATQVVEVITDHPPTISVIWDRIVQSFVIDTKIGPTRASDAYGRMHTAIYDAWADYTEGANPTHVVRYREIQDTSDEKKRMAMIQAAAKVLVEFFPEKESELNVLLEEMDAGNIKGKPRRIGKRCAETVMKIYSKSRKTDPDESPWKNDTTVTKMDLWQEEHIPIDDLTGPKQQYLTPKHGRFKTFGIKNGAEYRPEAPKKFLANNLEGEVDLEAKTITIGDGDPMEITRDLIGDVINPEFITQCEEVLHYSASLNDKNKLIAEFWEDGGGSSFPPGTWMTIGQYVSARDDHDDDKDAKMFLALGNAVRDAGIASWNAKLYYYYARPVRAIRNLGKLDLLGDLNKAGDEYVVRAYNPEKFKVKRILPENWQTYQTPGDHPSPPFAEYTSGHSCFSAAAARVLKEFTGSDTFGASIVFPAGSSRFEPDRTPKEDLTLEWKTFTDAADEAGISRLHGGIHFIDGNDGGKALGRKIGLAVYNTAKGFYEGITKP